MIRTLYHCLLCLHPPVFRRQFAGEMLWIFDQTTGSAAVRMLFLDGMVSLARQWLLRSGAWKLVAASAGGLLQITMGGFGWVLAGQLHGARQSPFEGSRTGLSPDLARLIYLAVWSVGTVVCSVIGLTLWIKKFTGRRIHHDA